jgi:outer membrane protein assembly factor BamA
MSSRGRGRGAALSVTLSAAWLLVGGAPTAQARTDVGAVPLVNYSSDEGLGMGVNGALFFRAPEYRPYRYGLSLNLFFTTRSIQDHMLRFDAPHFLGSAYRPTLMVRFERDPIRPYYGVGNDTSIDHTLDKATMRALYLHTLVQPQSALTVKRYLANDWEIAVTALGMWQRIEKAPTSLLARDAPIGVDGGVLTELSAELAYDSRDAEASPTAGFYGELVGRAGQLSAQHAYAGGALVARSYVSPFGTPALTVATRFDVDALAGDVPFTRLATFAGRPPLAGIGGAQSLRGIPRYLYIGKVKVIGNLELRSRVHRFRPGDHTLDLILVGFADAGRVWADYHLDDRLWRIHSAAGGGVRVAWEQDYLIRVDVAFSREGSSGLYIDFAQCF